METIVWASSKAVAHSEFANIREAVRTKSRTPRGRAPSTFQTTPQDGGKDCQIQDGDSADDVCVWRNSRSII